MRSVAFLIILSSLYSVGQCQLPVVLWHGMGDSCCSSYSLGKIINVLKENLNNVTVLSLKFGCSVVEDIESGYFKNVNKQVEEACNTIADNVHLQNGYNAIGFSQGAQFLRAVAQRCPSPPMRTLISLGGQHQGVYGVPMCSQPNPKWCDEIRQLLTHAAYTKWVQNSLVQAQFWHDPVHEDQYKQYSTFLADINNENEINQDYINNLSGLDKLVLVRFNKDTMVTPRDSSWFGFYAPGQSKEVLPYDQTDLWIQDRIGLQILQNNGRLDFLEVEGNHLQITLEWFVENIVSTYLKN